jgi:hypothetical protein
MKSKISHWYSSYEANNYDDLFYALICIYQPEKVVELGTRAGFSAYHIARALKSNGHGTLDCYDLWEEYVDNIGSNISKKLAQENLKEFQQIITLELKDATDIDKKYKGIDILHVDLDNDGEVLEKIVPAWVDKVRQFIIIEGGSLERDRAAAKTNHKKLPVTKWLNDLNSHQAASLKRTISNQSGQFVKVEGKQEYKEKPIRPWLRSFCKQFNLEYITFEPFPSVTIIKKHETT